MFTKALIFVLLGNSLVLATPLSEEAVEQHQKAKEALNKKKQELEDKLEELKESAPAKYEELKGKVSTILAEEKAKWESLSQELMQATLDTIAKIKDSIKNKEQ